MEGVVVSPNIRVATLATENEKVNDVDVNRVMSSSTRLQIPELVAVARGICNDAAPFIPPITIVDGPMTVVSTKVK